METGFFVTSTALGLEAVIFIATITCIAVQALRGDSGWTRRLWWPVAVSALAGVVAFSLSVHYVVRDPRDQSWTVFVVLTILLPLVLAVVVSSTLRRKSK